VKNSIFWDVVQYGPCKDRHFGGTYREDKLKVTNDRSAVL
jgi:hypothetical protein